MIDGLLTFGILPHFVIRTELLVNFIIILYSMVSYFYWHKETFDMMLSFTGYHHVFGFTKKGYILNTALDGVNC